MCTYKSIPLKNKESSMSNSTASSSDDAITTTTTRIFRRHTITQHSTSSYRRIGSEIVTGIFAVPRRDIPLPTITLPIRESRASNVLGDPLKQHPKSCQQRRLQTTHKRMNAVAEPNLSRKKKVTSTSSLIFPIEYSMTTTKTQLSLSMSASSSLSSFSPISSTTSSPPPNGGEELCYLSPSPSAADFVTPSFSSYQQEVHRYAPQQLRYYSRSISLLSPSDDGDYDADKYYYSDDDENNEMDSKPLLPEDILLPIL